MALWDPSSQTKDGTQVQAVRLQNPTHWTAREFLIQTIFKATDDYTHSLGKICKDFSPGSSVNPKTAWKYAINVSTDYKITLADLFFQIILWKDIQLINHWSNNPSKSYILKTFYFLTISMCMPPM